MSQRFGGFTIIDLDSRISKIGNGGLVVCHITPKNNKIVKIIQIFDQNKTR